jgi:carboxymethylenebutenolidase
MAAATWLKQHEQGTGKVLKTNKADYKAHFYAGAQHAFHNDSTSRYSPADADLSWQRTTAFFKKHLA